MAANYPWMGFSPQQQGGYQGMPFTFPWMQPQQPAAPAQPAGPMNPLDIFRQLQQWQTNMQNQGPLPLQGRGGVSYGRQEIPFDWKNPVGSLTSMFQQGPVMDNRGLSGLWSGRGPTVSGPLGWQTATETPSPLGRLFGTGMSSGGGGLLSNLFGRR